MLRQFDLRSNSLWNGLETRAKIDRYCAFGFDWVSIYGVGLKFPPAHGVNGGLGERFRAAQSANGLHSTVDSNHHVQDDDALHSCSPRFLRLNGVETVADALRHHG